MDKQKIVKILVTLLIVAVVGYGGYYLVDNGFQRISLKKFIDSEGSEKLNIYTSHNYITPRNTTEVPELEVFLVENGKEKRIYISRSEIWGCIDGEYESYKINSKKITCAPYIPTTISYSSDWDFSYFESNGSVESCGDSEMGGNTKVTNYIRKELSGSSEVKFVYGNASKELIISN